MGNEKFEKLKKENGWIGLTPEKKEIIKNLLISNQPLLTGEGRMIELDPNNPDHVEWFEDVDISEEERRVVSERLEQSLKEMNQIRNGELPMKTWRDVYLEIKEEDEKQLEE